MQRAIKSLAAQYPWTKSPLVVGAPMRTFASPALAVAVSQAGGLGFIGPGEKPELLEKELETARELLAKSGSSFAANTSQGQNQQGSAKSVLPIGVGIITWCSDLGVTKSILEKSRDSLPAAIWLFAPRHGQRELDEWCAAIRSVSKDIQIWLQFASVKECVEAVKSSHAPDVIVAQGIDAGGHSLVKGAGLITLLPEVCDALAEAGSQAPVIAAGGIVDARGAAASFVLGASGIVLGTRLLMTPEARINAGYQRAIQNASDGGQSTVKTQLYNHLRGTMGWPAEYDPRGLINASWRDHQAGVTFEKLKELHAESMEKGEGAWGEEAGRTATYAGTGVGLIKDIQPAGDIVRAIRQGIDGQLNRTKDLLNA